MNKSRIDFKNYEIVNSGAKFYKGKDCEEGFYHVCDEYAPGGTRLLEFMPCNWVRWFVFIFLLIFNYINF